MSRSTLEARFRETIGRSIHAEIRRVQIDAARRLLITTEHAHQGSRAASWRFIGAVFHGDDPARDGPDARRDSQVVAQVEVNWEPCHPEVCRGVR